MPTDLHTVFNRARIDDRLVNELLGLSKGIVADGMVSQDETEFLQKWLVANSVVSENPVAANLLQRINAMLKDKALDEDEAKELFETLVNFSGGDFELGELQKSTGLPIDDPLPELEFPRRRYCFTGTFAYGSRRECENTVAELGGTSGSLTLKTDFLVIGIYATDSWAHSAYGRKIERAVQLRDEGHHIGIVGEKHWLTYVRA